MDQSRPSDAESPEKLERKALVRSIVIQRGSDIPVVDLDDILHVDDSHIQQGIT